MLRNAPTSGTSAIRFHRDAAIVQICLYLCFIKHSHHFQGRLATRKVLDEEENPRDVPMAMAVVMIVMIVSVVVVVVAVSGIEHVGIHVLGAGFEDV